MTKRGRPTSAERAAIVAVTVPRASAKQAARALGITERALESRLSRLYAKLDVSSAAQAAIALMRLDSE